MMEKAVIVNRVQIQSLLKEGCHVMMTTLEIAGTVRIIEQIVERKSSKTGDPFCFVNQSSVILSVGIDY